MRTPLLISSPYHSKEIISENLYLRTGEMTFNTYNTLPQRIEIFVYI